MSDAAPLSQPPTASHAEMSAAGLRAFFNIAHAWNLNAEEQIILLGAPGRSTFFKWKAAPQSARLGRDTLERLSLLLGIYKALQILLPQPAAADGWIKRPNSAPPFGGRPALERMLAGNISDLVAVRQYLDAMRGGWA
ncbi:MbcA/ParS/Xre antitoxin family protein [Paraburkholderia bonniea]|uniref:MbcA/ParS/Xre antitoxin family protein n=1 Tax=Paraburkholderia bonniea TaxID=2152891 RepID=UPI001FE58B21|nr:MbcA/ParS/Xre antitoxin family protein [Paraburkholderia bonniea]WJF91697.1 MbcA/ParS/Xre antitoxin family protein [Paraburkholderia bonniea]WJF95017.1 MbcA/ParS/Xre antitoxin family protein [Paraburkholderia bonniea]